MNSIEHCGDIGIAELIHQLNELTPILEDGITKMLKTMI